MLYMRIVEIFEKIKPQGLFLYSDENMIRARDSFVLEETRMIKYDICLNCISICTKRRS